MGQSEVKGEDSEEQHPSVRLLPREGSVVGVRVGVPRTSKTGRSQMSPGRAAVGRRFFRGWKIGPDDW